MAAAIFYQCARFAPVIVRHPLWFGMLYGGIFYLVMLVAVLPLTALPPAHFPPPHWIPITLANLFCVGVPIALVVRRLGPSAR